MHFVSRNEKPVFEAFQFLNKAGIDATIVDEFGRNVLMWYLWKARPTRP